MTKEDPTASLDGARWTPTKEQGWESFHRLINSHFHVKPMARASIPARPREDDDLVASAYFNTLEEELKQLRAIAGLLETAPPMRISASTSIIRHKFNGYDVGVHSILKEETCPICDAIKAQEPS